MMVTPDSAQQYWPREKSFACNTDHSQLAKLKRGENGVYPNIRRAIQQKIHTSAAIHTVTVPSAPHVLREQEIQSINTSKRRSMMLDEVVVNAIVTGDAVQLRYLLDDQYDVNCRGKKGFTILLLAAFLRQEDIIKAALDYGADTRAATEYGNTTLHLVALHVVDIEANIVSDDDRQPLTRSVMEILLQYNPPLESLSGDGATPLINAARRGQTLAVRCLMEYGGDITAMDVWGGSALHYAASDQREDIVALLIAHGAPVNARKNDGRTPLHMVALHAFSIECASIVRSLMTAGANLEAVDTKKSTPLLIAVSEENIKYAEELLQWGANIDARDGSGCSALHRAASSGSVSMVQLLLGLGANPCAVDDAGHLPFESIAFGYWFGKWKETRQILRVAEKNWKKSHR